MVFSVCDYSHTSCFNSIPVSVIARILDFNNSVEYYQTENTLITSLALWLFDNSIFHCRLLCLMPSQQRSHPSIKKKAACASGWTGDSLINISHLYSELWAKIRWPPFPSTGQRWLWFPRQASPTRTHTSSREEEKGGRAGAGVISADCERTVAPLGELAIMGETMFTSISCQEDLWPHFAVMEN